MCCLRLCERLSHGHSDAELGEMQQPIDARHSSLVDACAQFISHMPSLLVAEVFAVPVNSKFQHHVDILVCDGAFT
jgi:hypothetical protein